VRSGRRRRYCSSETVSYTATDGTPHVADEADGIEKQFQRLL